MRVIRSLAVSQEGDGKTEIADAIQEEEGTG